VSVILGNVPKTRPNSNLVDSQAVRGRAAGFFVLRASSSKGGGSHSLANVGGKSQGFLKESLLCQGSIGFRGKGLG
jgi:hypothetical protein